MNERRDDECGDNFRVKRVRPVPQPDQVRQIGDRGAGPLGRHTVQPLVQLAERLDPRLAGGEVDDAIADAGVLYWLGLLVVIKHRLGPRTMSSRPSARWTPCPRKLFSDSRGLAAAAKATARLTWAGVTLPGGGGVLGSACNRSAPERPSFEEWKKAGGAMQQVEGALHWWIGDWFRYAEEKSDEETADMKCTTKPPRN